MCSVNMLCHLQVEYSIAKVFIVEYDLSVKLKNHSFPDMFIWLFFYSDVKNSFFKFVKAF